jgi:hypothetical protein
MFDLRAGLLRGGSTPSGWQMVLIGMRGAAKVVDTDTRHDGCFNRLM